MTLPLLLLMIASAADVSPFAECLSSPERVGKCIVSQGVISGANGAYSTRSSLRNSAHKAAAICQPGLENPCEYMPSSVAVLLDGKPNEIKVHGTYTFCPLARPEKNKLLIGCVAGAEGVIAQPVK